MVAETELVVPVQPSGSISAVTASSSGWFATLSGRDSTPVIQIWTLPGLVHLRTMQVKATRAIAAHPTKPLIACGSGYSFAVMDADTGILRVLNERLPDQLNALVWSPDGAYVMAGWHDLLRVNPETGAAQKVATMPRGLEVGQMRFVAGGKQLLVAGVSRSAGPSMVLAFDTVDWREVRRFEGFTGRTLMAVDAAETMLATVDSQTTLRIWDLGRNEEPRVFALQDRTAPRGPFGNLEPRSLVFSDDGKGLAIHAWASGFRVFNLATGRIGESFPEFGALSGEVAPVYAQHAIVSGGADGNLYLLDGSLRYVVKSSVASPGTVLVSAAFTRSGVLAVAIPRHKLTGDYQVTGAWLLNRTMERAVSRNDHPIGAVAKRRGVEGPFLVLCDARGLVFRNLTTRTAEKFDRVDWADRVSADGRWVAGLDRGAKRLRLFDTLAGREVSLALGQENPLVVLSPAGNAVAAVPRDGKSEKVRLWSLPDARELAPFEAKVDTTRDGNLMLLAGTVDAITFSPDGSRLAVLHGDRRARLWNVASGKVETTLDTPIQSGGTLEFSPDGKRLAVAGRDGSVSVWTLDGSAAPVTIGGVGPAPEFMAFREDGAQLLVGTAANTMTVVHMREGKRLGQIYLASPNGPWMAYTDQGFFDGSEEMWNSLVWRFNGKTMQYATAGRYFGDFFEPRLVQRILAGDLPKAPASIEAVDRKTAELEIRVLADAASGGRTVELEIAPKLTQGAGVRDLRLFRNGVMVHRWDGEARGAVLATVRLEAGRNQFSVYGFNAAKVRSEPATLELQGNENLRRPGTLHVLAIGINKYAIPGLRLNYAVNDAQWMAAVLKAARGSVAELARVMTGQVATARLLGSDYRDQREGRFVGSGGPADVVVLTDGEATRKGILDGIRAMTSRALPEDSFLLFFAGHGMADGQSYYLFPQDVVFRGNTSDLAAMRGTAISDEDLAIALADLDVAASALILDACESGQTAQAADDLRRGPIDARGLAQLAYEKDIYLLAAAQSGQAAQELEKLHHGLLTWALMEEGLREGRALDDSDDGLELGDWLAWGAWRVPTLDGEVAAVKRGTKLPEQSAAGATVARIQQPTLLARRRPDAIPMIVTASTVDIDPVTLTASGTLSTAAVAPAGPKGLVVPDSDPGDAVAVAVSPSEDWVAVVESVGRVRVRRLPDLLAIREFEVPGRVVSAALSPDGATLACLMDDASVSLADVASGTVKKAMPKFSLESQSKGRIEWSADGAGLVLSLSDALRIVDPDTGRVTAQKQLRGLSAWWTDRKFALATMSAGQVNGQFFGGDVYAGRLDGSEGGMRKIGTHPGLRAGAYDPQRMLALTVGADRKARFWDTKAGKMAEGPALDLKMEPSAALFHDGLFYIAGSGGDVYVVSGPGDAPRVGLRSNGWRYAKLAAAGSTVAAASDLSVAVWRQGDKTATGLVRSNMTAEYVGFRGVGRFIIAGVEMKGIGDHPSSDLFSYSFEGTQVKRSVLANAGVGLQPFGDAGLVSDNGQSATVYDAAGLRKLGTLPIRPTTASVNADLSRVVLCVGTERHQLFVAEPPLFRARPLDGQAAGECGLSGWLPSAVAFARSPLEIGVYPLNGSVPRLISVPGADLDSLTALAFDASGERVAVATNSAFALLSLGDGGRERKLPSAGLGLVRRMAFRPDGKQLAAADMDGHLALLTFEPDDTKTLQLEGVRSSPVALAFSPNGIYLSVLAEDGICGIYRTDTGVRVAKISPVAGTTDWAVETPDGRFDVPKTSWAKIFRRSEDRLVDLNTKADGYTPGLLAQVLEGK